MSPTPPQLRIVGVTGLPEIHEGDDLASLLTEAANVQETPFQERDVVVVTQKIVSKAEGRLIAVSLVEPSALARELARWGDRDPRHIEVVLREARRIVRAQQGVIITETHHGFICANSGVDASNVPEAGVVSRLPLDPDASAEAIRRGIRQRAGVKVAVIISDTFGRPWREGAENVAIGIAGLAPLRDYRGQKDAHGHLMRTTVIAVADELAAAAELVTNKTTGVPAAIIRGYPYEQAQGSIRALLRHPSQDLFR